MRDVLIAAPTSTNILPMKALSLSASTLIGTSLRSCRALNLRPHMVALSPSLRKCRLSIGLMPPRHREPRTVEMTEIRYFRAVCETLNFHRAAGRCHVTQPALSRAIQKLEAELGGSCSAVKRVVRT
ncbi:MAG TPA: LysR family transcriptional regulator [Hyphomicrobiaceae bacterium]|nr:LysR family transcriptional regulator [Hyphomicrobiaceae bacterium]